MRNTIVTDKMKMADFLIALEEEGVFAKENNRHYNIYIMKSSIARMLENTFAYVEDLWCRSEKLRLIEHNSDEWNITEKGLRYIEKAARNGSEYTTPKGRKA